MAQRSWAEVGRRGDQQPSRLVRLATAGVAANSALLLLVALYRVAAFPLEPGHTIQVLVATACVLPPTVWLVLSAARNTRPRGRGWALAGVAAVTLGGLPVIGADWLGGAFATLAALVLIVIRPPWSFLLFAGLAATPWPVGVAFGRPDVGLYETAVLLLNAPPLALLVWLIAKTRELQAARLALAEEAVVRERLNIDDELRRTLGTALEDIAARADRSTDLALRDHAEAARVLGALVEDSRGTLAEARRLVRRYQTVSLRAELETAAALLSAAGIQTRVVLPPGEPPHEAPEPLRSQLRAGTARLLGDSTVRRCVITMHRRAGRFELDMRAEPAGLTPTDGTAR